MIEVTKIKNGFSLVEAMVGVAITGIVAMVIYSTAKHQAKNSTVTQADSELASMAAQITALISSPSGCNANFRNTTVTIGKNVTTNGSITYVAGQGIFKCTNSAGCPGATTSANTSVVFPIVSNTSVFASFQRARIVAISGNLEAGASGVKSVVPLTIDITFQKRLSDRRDPSVAADAGQFSTVKRKFATSMVMGTTGTGVDGCPRNPSSTLIY